MPCKPRPVEERFLAKVDKTSSPHGCWLWTGATQRGGYGCLQVGTHYAPRIESAPRIAWKLYRGPIPPDADVLHDCPGGDNKACCNPAHLHLGDQKMNAAEAEAKGQYHHPIGTAHGRAKLDPDKVRLIRKLYAETSMSARQIGEQVGVHGQTVYAVLWDDTWGHVK